MVRPHEDTRALQGASLPAGPHQDTKDIKFNSILFYFTLFLELDGLLLHSSLKDCRGEGGEGGEGGDP